MRVSHRPYRADGFGGDAFPKVRFASSGLFSSSPYGRNCLPSGRGRITNRLEREEFPSVLKRQELPTVLKRQEMPTVWRNCHPSWNGRNCPTAWNERIKPFCEQNQLMRLPCHSLHDGRACCL